MSPRWIMPRSSRFRAGFRAASAWLLVLVTAAGPAAAGGLALGVDLGTSGGLGAQVSGTLVEFTRTAPLSARVGLGYFTRDPGNPYDARRIFINDNTNGTPDKSGHTWQFRFDLVFPVMRLGAQPLQLAVGARHARSTAHFEYIGGNESFDVTTNPWGLGLAVETGFPTGDRSAFVLEAGVDRYFDAPLTGHDTTYDPDGAHVRPRDDYSYEDARSAANAPGFEFVGLVGWRLVL
jgi:hypothetical protein